MRIVFMPAETFDELRGSGVTGELRRADGVHMDDALCVDTPRGG
jgi:hypothetical protein